MKKAPRHRRALHTIATASAVGVRRIQRRRRLGQRAICRINAFALAGGQPLFLGLGCELGSFFSGFGFFRGLGGGLIHDQLSSSGFCAMFSGVAGTARPQASSI